MITAHPPIHTPTHTPIGLIRESIFRKRPIYVNALTHKFPSTISYKTQLFFYLESTYGVGAPGPRSPKGPAGFFGAQRSQAPSGAEVKFSYLNCNFNGFNDINCTPPPTPTPTPQKSALTFSKHPRII